MPVFGVYEDVPLRCSIPSEGNLGRKLEESETFDRDRKLRSDARARLELRRFRVSRDSFLSGASGFD